MKVKITCINEGQTGQHYCIVDAEENQVLWYAPNNWKTVKGAEKWAERHGYEKVQQL